MKGRNFERVEKVCFILFYNLLVVISTLCQKYNIIIFNNSCDSIHNHNFHPPVFEKNINLYINMI